VGQGGGYQCPEEGVGGRQADSSPPALAAG